MGERESARVAVKRFLREVYLRVGGSVLGEKIREETGRGFLGLCPTPGKGMMPLQANEMIEQT